MSKIDLLLKEIETLKASEIQLLFQKLLKKYNHIEDAQKLLAKYKGIGKGIWKKDAQQLVSDGRKDERF